MVKTNRKKIQLMFTTMFKIMQGKKSKNLKLFLLRKRNDLKMFTVKCL